MAGLLVCGGVAAAVLSSSGSSHKHPVAPTGPLARLSPTATRRLEAADTTLMGLATSANTARLRSLVAEYKAASAATRTGILKQIAKLEPGMVNRGPFAEPTSLNEAQLRTRLAVPETNGGAAAASHAVSEALASIRGAGFQTVVGTATGAVGTLEGPLSVPQYLNDDVMSLKQAGLPSEAERLTHAEEALPPAPAAKQAVYAQQLEGIVATANAAASAAVAALRSEHAGRYGDRVYSAATKLELTPPATFASFAAALRLRPTLKDLAVNLNVLFVGGNHVTELNHQLKTLGTTVAAAVTGLTGPGAACAACTAAAAAHYTPPESVANCGSAAGATTIVAHEVSCAVAVAALETYEGAPCGHNQGPCGQSGINAVHNGQSAVECDRETTKLSCVIVAGGLGGRRIGALNATVAERTEPQTAQCGTQEAVNFTAYRVVAHGMTCGEATALIKRVEKLNPGWEFPPGYECSAAGAELTCTSGDHSFSFSWEP